MATVGIAWVSVHCRSFGGALVARFDAGEDEHGDADRAAAMPTKSESAS